MSKIIHMRGDVTGMLIFFIFAFLGAWQFVIALFRLNGLSLTGYPDRKYVSTIIGAALIGGSCAWYFSQPGHFASPDVEGIETLILLVAGIVVSTFLQAALASVARLVCRPWFAGRTATAPTIELSIDVGGSAVPASFEPVTGTGPSGVPVVLLHDYGGSRRDLAQLAGALAAKGHATLAIELDGHGDSPREIASPEMRELLVAALSALGEKVRSETPAVVGVGLGGAIAIGLAAEGLADKAVALDPPARDEDGYAAVSALRELGPLEVTSSFIRPPARAVEGRRLSLARLLKELPSPGVVPFGRVTVIGTNEKWFNDPGTLKEFARAGGLAEPLMISTSHSAIVNSPEAVEAVLKSLA